MKKDIYTYEQAIQAQAKVKKVGNEIHLTTWIGSVYRLMQV